MLIVEHERIVNGIIAKNDNAIKSLRDCQEQQLIDLKERIISKESKVVSLETEIEVMKGRELKLKQSLRESQSEKDEVQLHLARCQRLNDTLKEEIGRKE